MSSDIKFGTDGWRAVIGWDFNFDNVRRAAQAIADFINENAPSSGETDKKTAVVGFDRRFLSDKFAFDIAAILRSNKVDVTLLDGPVSTPVLSFLTMEKYWLGVMVTASHNTPNYNGIKIRLEGAGAQPKTTKEIEALIDQNPVLHLFGQKAEEKNLTELYLKHISKNVNLKKISALKGKVVVDYMYGSAAGYIEKLLGKEKVIPLRDEYDPSFKGIQPEPVDETLSALKKSVPEKKAIAGFAFDGDGDRIAVVDEKGNYLTPEIVSAILLDYLIKYRKVKGKIIQTLSMGYLNKRIARKFNMQFEEVSVGFKNIAEKMRLEEIAFGVEESGSYAWKGSLPDKDGPFTAMTFLEIMAVTGKKASELADAIVKEYGASAYLRSGYPMTKPLDKNSLSDKIKKKLPKKILNFKVAAVYVQDGLKIIFEGDEWLLIRPSGTEPVLRIYGETADKKTTKELLDYGYKLAAPFFK